MLWTLFPKLLENSRTSPASFIVYGSKLGLIVVNIFLQRLAENEWQSGRSSSDAEDTSTRTTKHLITYQL